MNWEFDPRPTQPCVVCRGVPDRTVELPRLPDVHVAFLSSAMCSDCAAAAAANDVDGLTDRAATGWADDDPDVVPDLVRLVLASAGHVPPPKPRPPAEFRDPAPAPLSPADAAVWAQLEPLIYDGPGYDVVVSGRIVSEDDGEQSVTVVQRSGARVRLSDESGEPSVITDGITVWSRGDGDMVASSYDGEASGGDGTGLARRRTRREVDLFGFGQPIGPLERTEYLGRAAWKFAFAAPAHKPYDMKVIVDADTGLVLEKRFGDFSIARWTEFDTTTPIDPDRFTWTGPSVPVHELEAAQEREHEADLARRAAWFADHVTARPLTLAGAPVTALVHDWTSDGGFEASLDGGLDAALARRPRSDSWWALGWSDVTHRWSDDSWDWAMMIVDDDVVARLDPAALAEFVRSLGSSLD